MPQYENARLSVLVPAKNGRTGAVGPLARLTISPEHLDKAFGKGPLDELRRDVQGLVGGGLRLASAAIAGRE